MKGSTDKFENFTPDGIAAKLESFEHSRLNEVLNEMRFFYGIYLTLNSSSLGQNVVEQLRKLTGYVLSFVAIDLLTIGCDGLRSVHVIVIEL